MPPRVVLDPGVLVAAAIAPSGVCARLLDAALDGRIGLIVCPALTQELRDVLHRPKFRRYLSPGEVDRFVALVERVAEHHPDPTVETAISADPDDEYLVALARAAEEDSLVSGDPHLLDLGDPGPPVLRPPDLLARIT